jgi:hypothetical protein
MHSLSACPTNEHASFALSGFLQTKGIFQLYLGDPATYELAGRVFGSAVSEFGCLVAK